jgi:hypothetical protein
LERAQEELALFVSYLSAPALGLVLKYIYTRTHQVSVAIDWPDKERESARAAPMCMRQRCADMIRKLESSQSKQTVSRVYELSITFIFVSG